MSEGAPGRPTVVEDDGSMTVELVALVPVLVLFVLVIVAFGRYEVVRGDVTQAARAAAEAAAVAPSAESARQDATTAAGPVLGGGACGDPAVVLDTSTFVPGGAVRAVVTCHVALSDIGMPGLPGTSTVSAEAMAPIDPYRTVTP